MTRIVTDIEKVNTLKSTIIIFFPNGELIGIEKIPDLNYHIEYLKILYQFDERIKKILSNVNLKHCLKHPEELSIEILPKLMEKNCTVYMNTSPHVISPTDMATIWLPQERSQETIKTFNQMKPKFTPIIFLDIGEYNSKEKIFNSKLEKFEDKPNSNILYNLINHYQEQQEESKLQIKKLGINKIS